MIEMITFDGNIYKKKRRMIILLSIYTNKDKLNIDNSFVNKKKIDRNYFLEIKVFNTTIAIVVIISYENDLLPTIYMKKK